MAALNRMSMPFSSDSKCDYIDFDAIGGQKAFGNFWQAHRLPGNFLESVRNTLSLSRRRVQSKSNNVLHPPLDIIFILQFCL